MPVTQSAILTDGPFRTTLFGGLATRAALVESLTANRTVVPSDNGTIFLCNKAASLVIALPAISSTEVGFTCTFYYQTTVSGGSSTITAQTGDLLVAASVVTNWDTDSSNVAAFYSPNGTTNLITTLNGTTTGGLLGSKLVYTAITGVGWLVEGQVFANGAVATPFS